MYDVLARIEERLARLEAGGLPQGAWLLDVMQARDALARCDDVFRRLQNALIEEPPNT